MVKQTVQLFRDPSGGSDPECAGGGVGTLLGIGLPSLEGERERLVPLLSSIVLKWRKRARKVNPKHEERNAGWLLAQDEGDIYSL
jgi:hypothetical protein